MAEEGGQDLEQVFEVLVRRQGAAVKEGLYPVFRLTQFFLIEGSHCPFPHLSILGDEIDQLPVVDRPLDEFNRFMLKNNPWQGKSQGVSAEWISPDRWRAWRLHCR